MYNISDSANDRRKRSKMINLRKVMLILAFCFSLTGCQWADRMAEDIVTDAAGVLKPFFETEYELAPEDGTGGQEQQSEQEQQREERAEQAVAPITGNLTVADLKSRYNASITEIQGPGALSKVSADEVFRIRFESKFSKNIPLGDIISVHTDPAAQPQSKIDSPVKLEDYTYGPTTITVSPPLFGVLSSSYTYEAGEKQWGNASAYYIRINYDLESSSPLKLDKPLIIPFEVDTGVPVPELSYKIGKDGRLKLMWKPVPGAESYHIYNVFGNEKDGKENLPNAGPEQGYEGNYPILIGMESKTEFDDFGQNGNGGFFASDNEEIYSQNGIVNGDYYVTAIIGDKESSFSNPVNTHALSGQLPKKIQDDDLERLLSLEHAEDLPAAVQVEYIDGALTKRDILYDTSRLRAPREKDYGTRVYYRISGTALRGILYITDITEKKIGELKDRQANLPPEELEAFRSSPVIGNSRVPDIKSWEERHADDKRKEADKTNDKWDRQRVPDSDILNEMELNADSALEEYLARFMIDGQRKVPLRAFPETEDTELLYDTVNKVYFQNPMIMGVKNYRYSPFSETLHITYHDSQKTMKNKQFKTLKAARQIIASTLKAGMTEEEKRLALYNYLDENAVYDDDAYENSELHDFEYVDDEFIDAYTAYGVMVEKQGVCMSYAYAYKMLGDLAGIDNIIVTGTLDDVPHAWNKVKIGEEWLNVDATNGATNAGVPYYLYNANDAEAAKLNFHFDKDYMLDSELSNFKGKSNANDYYVVHGLEVKSLQEFKAKLVEGLQAGDEWISLRLATDLDEDEVLDAISEVFYQYAPELAEDAEYYEVGNYVVVYP